MVTPPRYVAYEQELAWRFRQAFAGRKPFASPVHVQARFWRRSKVKADGDNLLKALLDAGNGIAWEDDSLAVSVRYRVDLDGQNPGIEVQVVPDYGEWP